MKHRAHAERFGPRQTTDVEDRTSMLWPLLFEEDLANDGARRERGDRFVDEFVDLELRHPGMACHAVWERQLCLRTRPLDDPALVGAEDAMRGSDQRHLEQGVCFAMRGRREFRRYGRDATGTLEQVALCANEDRCHWCLSSRWNCLDSLRRTHRRSAYRSRCRVGHLVLSLSMASRDSCDRRS
jgi:hypothetical protein